MTVFGSPAQFAQLFPDDFLEDIIGRVPVAWNRIPKPVSEFLETRITKLLRHQYAYDPVIKQLPFQVRRELPIDDPLTGEELGRIDLCLLHGNSEATYFAFECKRLNVTFPAGNFAPLTGKYVGSEGMDCFVSGQYSMGHRFGGMSGYVFDGDIAGIQRSIETLIQSKTTDLAMSTSDFRPCSFLPNDASIRETVHTLTTQQITLFHIFLSMRV